MAEWELEGACCSVDGQPLLNDVGPEFSLELPPRRSANARGVFLVAQLLESKHRHVLTLGGLVRMRRFTSCYRYDPYWMRPRVGVKVSDLEVDTQYVLFELEEGDYLLMIPLTQEPYHASIGAKGSGLSVVLDSGAPDATAPRALAAYLLRGNDPFDMMRHGAREVCDRLGKGRLRTDKELPSFVDKFGWCTWDAFYRDVSREKLALGLESFRAGGVSPKILVLDDGWQSVDEPTNEGRITSFSAGEKFERELSPTVRLAKEEYGVETFMVWHAVFGYWGGAHPRAFREFGARPILRWYSPEVLSHEPAMNAEYCGPQTYRPDPGELSAFYSGYHDWLRQQGVDGVKVDNQSSLEGLAHDVGGRVVLWEKMRRALEASTRKHFGGALINCMSNASECYYFAHDSTVTRTSTDFWPRRPETHGLHLYVNALVSLWFGEFNQPDWDMFQSGHPVGAYHGAARAISGGPLYVSDEPDGHDFDLLRRLVLSDGTIPRCQDIARPTLDCLFRDPTTEDVLLKMFNGNVASAVVGAFNARYKPDSVDPITGCIGPGDVPGLDADRYAVYLGQADSLHVLSREDSVPLTLDTLQFEVATVAPIRDGFAVIGLVDKQNPGGTVRALGPSEGSLVVELRDGGRLLCHAERPALRASFEGRELSMSHSADEQRLEVDVPGPGRVMFELAGE